MPGGKEVGAGRIAELEDELERMRVVLQNLIDRAPFGVHRWELATDGQLVFAGANEAANRILGLDHGPLVGKGVAEAFPSLVGTQIPDAYGRVARTGELYEDERVTYQDDRVSGAFEIHAFQTSPGRMAVLFRDITERARVETALRQSEGRLQSIFRAAPVGIGVVVNRVITEANERFCDMTGYTKEELVGRSARLLYPDDEEFERVGRVKYAEIDHRGTGSVETRWRRRDGSEILVMLSSTPLFPGDLSAGVTFTALDVTDRRRAEEERLRLEARMQQTQKLESLGVLAGGIAHDFNNILMAILGHADLAQAQLSPVSPARENIQEIERSARRAADLCRQMLAYSGKGRFIVQPLDLSEVVQEMAHMLQVSVSKKAALRMNLASGLPPVEADVAQLRQVVMNLVINGSEAIGDASGVISLSTGVTRCDAEYLAGTYVDQQLAPGRYLFLDVTDSGCGMDEATRARIFEPFYSTKFTGRGLGLAAVLGVVRGHRGAIKVYSEPGRGSTFKVLLPASEQVVQRLGSSQTAATGWRGHGTVLLVDDEESVRSVTRKMLERLGFTVVTAADGREAVGRFSEAPERFSCVLMDLTMPSMDGEEAYRELRHLRPDVRVILSSGYSEQEAVQHFVGKGLAGFIQKPYLLSVLAEKLRRALEDPPPNPPTPATDG